MPGSLPRPTSVRKRVRYLTSLACVLACTAGLLVFASGHPLHGVLLFLGGLVLAPGSIWGRRYKHHLADTRLITPHGGSTSRRWRKLA